MSIGWLRRLVQFGLVAVALVISVVVDTPSASAHADYDRSEPADGAVIPEAPETLEVWFTQEVKKVAGANSIEVVGPDGEVVSGEIVIDDNDRTHISVPLNLNLPDGVYTVQWMTTSDEDDETDDDEFSFTVSAGATVTATPTSTATGTATPSVTATGSATLTPGTPTATASPAPSADDDDGAPVLLIVVLAVAALAVVGAGVAWSRRR